MTTRSAPLYQAVATIAMALLGVCLAREASGASAKDAGWASVAGYRPGMGKEDARKVGLADCKAGPSMVECKAPRPLNIAGAPSTDSRIALDERTGRIESVEFQFSKGAYQAVAAALVARLGEATAEDGDFRADEWRRAGRGSCAPVLIWHRGGDEVLALCGAGWRRNGLTYLVADRQPGRGKAWSEIAAVRAKSDHDSASFNSK
ncbi:hypothetical protein [Xanthomonas citri]|uniref:Uncharacterized protein n=1 Tax=Xanthomonas citri pv. sesbaniae TaxID=473425 RepID=A0AAW4RPZ8_XANCI|nr:hypothetical protein [Xanthomonas citri]MBZ3918517.1 hypothetical protein [Xanthomonas campestris pv. trichodesmae]MBZ3925590.1 hypothetical protein [Xanthomonas citri pv. sesbaniae]